MTISVLDRVDGAAELDSPLLVGSAIRERAAELTAHPERVVELLGAGAEKARRLAGETMREVRDRMGFVPRRDT